MFFYIAPFAGREICRKKTRMATRPAFPWPRKALVGFLQRNGYFQAIVHTEAQIDDAQWTG